MTNPRHIDYPIAPMVRIYYCACGRILRPIGQVLLVSPPLHVHVCDLCRKTYSLPTLSGNRVDATPYPTTIVADVREAQP